MALETGKFGNMAVSGNDVCVALFTLDASGYIFFVVECKNRIDLDVSPRLKVAGFAASYELVLVACFVKMADEALDLCHSHMRTLYNLRVACGASQLFLPSHLLDMPWMAEKNVFENHLIFQI
jgi:hypothetical protein